MVPAFKWLCELLLNPRPGSQIEKVLMMSEEAQSKHGAAKCAVAVSVLFATDWRLSSFAPSIAWTNFSGSGSNSHST
jgi:hypothetical protein